jgi:hypothetical protein
MTATDFPVMIPAVNGRRFPQGDIPGTSRMTAWTLVACAFACTFLVGSLPIHAAQRVSLADPIGFFTNVASRLLQSELGVDLNRIQIYPTNQYTPSVHRLLQVTANVYDAATNRPISDYPFVPSVFRPQFTNDGGAIYICGYAEETGTNLLNVTMRDMADLADRAALQATDMVYGVPAIVGVKKGWPNFNEFGLQNDVNVARNLIFHRSVAGAPITRTNQVYSIGISNVFAVEAWNSFSNSFPRALKMTVQAETILVVTNETGAIVTGPDGLLLSNLFSVAVTTNRPASNWAGSGSSGIPLSSSFIIPVVAHDLPLPNSDYQHDLARFSTNASDLDNIFPIPRLWVNLKTRLRFALVDASEDRIVDYVNVSSSESPLEIAGLVASGASCDGNWTEQIGNLFCTNRFGGSENPILPTYGIGNQINISIGAIAVSDAFWRTYNGSVVDKSLSIAQFRDRLLGAGGGANFTDFAAPFTPWRKVHHYISWQANDPLVHHTFWDLVDLFSLTATTSFDFDTNGSPLARMLGTNPLNPHYRPWGGNPTTTADTSPPTKFDQTVKDPQVRRSDQWNFPTNGYPSLDWIGKIHRGTPWQTLYLKSTNTDVQTWQLWSGVTNSSEAQLTMPTNDWRMTSLIVSMLNTNDPHHLFSVNQPNPDAWRGVLDGLTVMTNIGPSQFDTLVMSSNSPQAATIASALDAMRANQPAQYFYDVGDILATAELSTASPWLNTSGGANSGITDEAYEKIPAQLLPLLRPDSIGLITRMEGGLHVRFSGIDGYAYAVQVSTDLSNWLTVSTNYPTNGFFDFVDNPLQKSPTRFCRSLLLP